jgi:hypothetical protein
MKRPYCAFLQSFSMFVWAAPQGQPAEYDINVRLSASRMVLEGNSTLHHQFLNVIIDDKTYELTAPCLRDSVVNQSPSAAPAFRPACHAILACAR